MGEKPLSLSYLLTRGPKCLHRRRQMEGKDQREKAVKVLKICSFLLFALYFFYTALNSVKKYKSGRTSFDVYEKRKSPLIYPDLTLCFGFDSNESDNSLTALAYDLFGGGNGSQLVDEELLLSLKPPVRVSFIWLDMSDG